MIKPLKTFDLKNKRILLRVDLNTPIQEAKVTNIANHVFLSGDSFKNIAPNIAESIGAKAIITRVLATLVFCIDIINVMLHAEKLIK